MKSQQITIPRIKFGAILGRFHAIIFTVLVGGGLAVAIYMFSNILDSSASRTNTQTETGANFDEEVIKNVEQLRKLSDTPKRPELPSGRTDPFPQ